MKGHFCHRCNWIFAHDEAAEEPLEFRYGGPGIRFLCPACFSRDIEEIFICPECQRERPVKGEDLGKQCLDAEQDALIEMQLDQFDERNAA